MVRSTCIGLGTLRVIAGCNDTRGAAAEDDGYVAGMMAGDDGNEGIRGGSRCSDSLSTIVILTSKSRLGLGLGLLVAIDLFFSRGDGVDDHSVSGELKGET